MGLVKMQIIIIMTVVCVYDKPLEEHGRGRIVVQLVM